MTRRWYLIAPGGACLVLACALGVGAARADSPPGSAWLAYSLSATAPGYQVTEDRTGASTHPEGEGEVPESVAQLRTGPEGYALSSVAWPGPLAANAGSLSQLLNLGLPSSTTDNLNEPVRAEARTGSGPPTVTNTSYPGTVMRASATPDDIEADTTMAGASGPAPQSHTGNTETSSSARLTGPASGVATASSTVQHVKLAGGLITIDSVTSSARATTNGVVGRASGGTTVTGLLVAGQPAYLDQSGLHLGANGPGEPVNGIASQVAQQALAGSGMKVAISEPSTHSSGAQVSYDAGDVVFYWAPPNSQGQTFTATFGGASVVVGASPGLGALPVVGGIGLDATSAPSAGPASSPVAAAAPSSPSQPSPPVPTPAVGSRSSVPSPASVVLASAPLGLPHGIPPAAPVLVLLGAGLIALGMRRLPDRVLQASSTTCPLGDRP